MISFANIKTIAKKDFRSYFGSPLAYIVMASFLFILGFMFSAIFENFINTVQRFDGGNPMMGGKTPSMSDMVLRPLFGNMNVVLLFLVPFITMRLFAEERRNNTIELLFTAPVSWWDIVLGKFISAFSFVAVMLSITLVYPAVMSMGAKPDLAVLAMGYLGTLCMVGVYVSVGMWCSSMTDSQIVAGITTLLLILFMWIIKWGALASTSVLSDILGYLSIVEHYEDFSRGVFNTKNLVFYFSATGIWLYMTHKSLESYSWRA